MCKKGDLIQIHNKGNNTVSEPLYIITKIEHNVDALDLYHHIKYTTVNYKTNKIKSFMVWDNVKITPYEIIKSDHSFKTYLYSLYYTLC